MYSLDATLQQQKDTDDRQYPWIKPKEISLLFSLPFFLHHSRKHNASGLKTRTKEDPHTTMAFAGYSHRQHYLLYDGKSQLNVPTAWGREDILSVTGPRTQRWIKKEPPASSPPSARRNALFNAGPVKKTQWGTKTVPFSSTRRGKFALDWGEVPRTSIPSLTNRPRDGGGSIGYGGHPSYDIRSNTRRDYVDHTAFKTGDRTSASKTHLTRGEYLPILTAAYDNPNIPIKMSMEEITQQNVDVTQIHMHGTTKNVVIDAQKHRPLLLTQRTAGMNRQQYPTDVKNQYFTGNFPQCRATRTTRASTGYLSSGVQISLMYDSPIDVHAR